MLVRMKNQAADSRVCTMLAGGLPSPMGQLDDEPAQLIPGLEPSVWISNEPFPIKLYKLLETTPPHIARWTASGQAFVIEDSSLMCTEVLPRFFRHERLASFQRQLNL